MTKGDGPYEDAAKLAVESHPLPGEDLHTTHVDDAEHWIRVYSELLDFKRALISEMVQRLPTMAPEAADEVERTDALVLQAEASRFENRLGIWRRRREELLPDEG